MSAKALRWGEGSSEQRPASVGLPPDRRAVSPPGDQAQTDRPCPPRREPAFQASIKAPPSRGAGAIDRIGPPVAPDGAAGRLAGRRLV